MTASHPLWDTGNQVEHLDDQTNPLTLGTDVEYSMKNFWTAIRDSIQHLPTIVLATICSVGIAILWSSNIGALYPVIDMTLKGDSMQSWLEKSSDASIARLEQLDSQFLASTRAKQLKQRFTGQSFVSESKSQPTIEAQILSEQYALTWKTRGLSWANALLPRDPFKTICMIMGVLIFSTLIKHLLMMANDLLIAHVSTSIVRGLRMNVFDVALGMDRKTYQTFGTSGLLAAITAAADGLAAGIMSLFGAAIREPLRVASCLIMACFISWRLLVLSVVLAPLLIFVVLYFNKKIRTIAASIMGRNAGFHEVLLEALSNIFTVQAFTMEKHEKERFSRCTDDMRRVNLKMIFYTGLSKPFTELIGIGMVAITVCAGAYLVVNKQTHIFFLQICEKPMSITDLLIFFGLLVGASDPLRKLSGVSVSIYNGAMAANFLYAILHSKPALPQAANPISLNGRHSSLSLKNVCFHYNPEHPILKNVEFELPFGKTVAILGSNGSGKSTLIQLLCRYYDPVDGSIEMDGVDVRQMAMQDLRKRVALVSQSTELFNRSVLENIQYGSPESTREQAIEAAKMAHAHQFIMDSLSEDYDTIVGQAGQNLSGGQRQRIALARAILRNPEILILDESTSQIDMSSEIQIRETLQSMKGKMTLVIITHREALIALADQVYYMKDGTLSVSTSTQVAA